MSGLTVTFSRSIDGKLTTETRQGWFIVEAEYPSLDGTILVQRVLAARIELPSPPDTTAQFFPILEFAKTFNETSTALNLHQREQRVLVRVVVKGDFLIDIEGNAVDGDPIALRLDHPPQPPTPQRPLSGTGVPGGDFTSWFFLTPERPI